MTQHEENHLTALFEEHGTTRREVIARGALLATGGAAGLLSFQSAALAQTGDQPDWRFCNKCNAMFFDGYPNKGHCPAGGAHVAQGFRFLMHFDAGKGDGARRQYDWRFCGKCNAMFFDGYPNKGRCAGGGAHNAAGWMFGLVHQSPTGWQQDQWRFCNKCEVLFYDGYQTKGSCAAGGGHVAQGYMFNINYEATSFCGFVDPPNRSGGVVPQSYGLKGASRGKSALSWSFNGTVPGVGAPAAVTPVLTRAFNNWRGAVPALSFTQLSSGADIAISVASLGAPGPTGQKLASTSPDGRTIQINAQGSFGATKATLKAGQTSLLNVMTHEIGHSLGLLHATTSNSIMFSFSNNLEALGSDDTAAMKALYGWQPQRKLQGGTAATPSICACGNTLVMVWRGVGDDHNIWISTSTEGENWTPQRKFGDVGTIASPAIAWDGRRLWMVWRGTGDDSGLYFKTSTDFFVRDNPAQQNVKGVGSSDGPRIAVIRNTPILVWKGSRDDGGIYFSRFEGGQWQPQANIQGVGTGSSPAICEDLGGGARLLWRGSRDDHNLYTTFSSPTFSSWQPQSVMRWTIPGNAGTPGTPQAAGTTAGPALARVADLIQAAWHGAKGDNGLWFTQLANDIVNGKTVQEWSAQANIPGVGSSDGPSIASFNGHLHMVWKGIPNDGGIYASTL